MKKTSTKINGGLFVLDFPPTAERYDRIFYFFLKLQKFVFPFLVPFYFRLSFPGNGTVRRCTCRASPRCGDALWPCRELGPSLAPPGTGTPSASGLGPGGAVPGKVLGLPPSWAGPGHLGE